MQLVGQYPVMSFMCLSWILTISERWATAQALHPWDRQWGWCSGTTYIISICIVGGCTRWFTWFTRAGCWKRCELNCWVAGHGDATEFEFVVADITFNNRDFPSEGSFGAFDDLDLFPTDITTSHNQKLHGHLDRTEQHTAKLEVADRRGQQTEAQDGTDNMAQGAPRTHPSLLSGSVGDRLGAVCRQETGDVSTVTVAVTNDNKTLSAPVAQANAGNNAATLPSLSQSASPVFIPHLIRGCPIPWVICWKNSLCWMAQMSVWHRNVTFLLTLPVLFFEEQVLFIKLVVEEVAANSV